ncbi:S8 family serine peptidase, partial [Bdellovibrionota bacterium]
FAQNYPEVKEVHPDREVKLFENEFPGVLLNDSVALIGADRVHGELNILGRGVRVAILDTGIDYSHPGLGGGIGPGFKVIGGYDLVNQDNDPMDGHSHGTHCAGIVAAETNRYVGVAPRASLLAYKVLSDAGRGYDSWIIGGIERAVDPDGNPATDDGAHVLSMSLGGGGDHEAPSSRAVDRAVQLGAVVVVAAGNDGPYPKSIHAPGAARNAITVGASDKADRIAVFSSRGPVPGLDVVKPDIVAPGVRILSTIPGMGEKENSGTSMATPHVAGLVALMLELNPSLTPRSIKDVLTYAAIDLGEDPYTQGWGRIDAMGSMKRPLFRLSRNSINAGIFDNFTEVKTARYEIVYENLTDSGSEISVSVDSGSLPPEIKIEVFPTRAFIRPGEKQNFETVITVLQTAPVPKTPPFQYKSSLNFKSDKNEKNAFVPIILQRSKTITVHINEMPGFFTDFVTVGDRSGFFVPQIRPRENDIKFAIGDGLSSYFLTANFSNATTTRWLLFVDQTSDYFVLDPRDARYKVIFQPKDERGRDISHLDWYITNDIQIFRDGPFSLNVEQQDTKESNKELYFNRASEEFTFYLRAHEQWQSRLYDYVFSHEGLIENHLVFTTDELDIIPVEFSSQIDPDSYDLYFWWHLPKATSQHGIFSSNSVRELVLTPFDDSYNWAFSLVKYYKSPSKWFWSTPRMRVQNGDLQFVTKPGKVYHDQSLDKLHLGKGLPLPAVAIENLGSKLELWSEADVTCGAAFIFPETRDSLTNAFPYPRRAKLYRNGLFDKDIPLCFFAERWNSEEFRTFRLLDVPIDGGTYSVEFKSPPYLVMNEEGTGVLKLTSVGFGSDRTAPMLRSIRFLRNGSPTEEFGGWFSENEIQVKFENENPPASVELFQRSGSGAWEILSYDTTKSGKRIVKPKTNRSGMQAFRIVATDEAGNEFDYVLDPAFSVR